VSRRSVLVLTILATTLRVTASLADGPLPIRAPGLVVPIGVLTEGVSPEAQVKVAIDARGVVTAVDVLSLTPPSEDDAILREQVVQTLKTWRYAPATRDGKPEATTLTWRIRFPDGPPTGPPSTAAAGVSPFARPSPIAGGDAERARAAILALPLAQRIKMLERETRRAIGLLDPKHMRKVATPRFVVRTDADGGERVAKTIADNLEAIFNVLEVELLTGTSLQPEPYKVQVVVYRSRAQYAALVSQVALFENSVGIYNPAGFIAFHLEQPTSEMVTGTLLHEATHAFLDRHVVRHGVALPRWLGEGFADYVANSAIERGRLKPGKTIARQYTFVSGRAMAIETEAGARLEDAKTALRRGKGLGLPEMLAASADTFYGEKVNLYYSSAWLLVHFLRDGGERPDGAEGAASAGRDRFRDFLLYVAEGYPQEAAFDALYGAIPQAQSAFERYVKEF
jgi:hypothetical protein